MFSFLSYLMSILKVYIKASENKSIYEVWQVNLSILQVVEYNSPYAVLKNIIKGKQNKKGSKCGRTVLHVNPTQKAESFDYQPQWFQRQKNHQGYYSQYRAQITAPAAAPALIDQQNRGQDYDCDEKA